MKKFYLAFTVCLGAIMAQAQVYGTCFYTNPFGNGFSYSVKTFDGAVLNAGNGTRDNATDGPVALLKTDSSNNIVWCKTYNAPGYYYPTGLVESRNHNYYVSFLSSIPSLWGVIKTDSSGNFLWAKLFTTAANGYIEILSLAAADDDDGVVLACGTNSLIKCDANGNLQWAKKYSLPSAFSYGGNPFIIAPDSTGYFFIMDCYTGSTYWQLISQQIDTGGNPQWQYTYSRQYANPGAVYYRLIKLDNGKWLACHMVPVIGNTTPTVMEFLSIEGNGVLDNTFDWVNPTSGFEPFIRDIAPAGDSSFVASGWVYFYANPVTQYLFLAAGNSSGQLYNSQQINTNEGIFQTMARTSPNSFRAWGIEYNPYRQMYATFNKSLQGLCRFQPFTLGVSAISNTSTPSSNFTSTNITIKDSAITFIDSTFIFPIDSSCSTIVSCNLTPPSITATDSVLCTANSSSNICVPGIYHSYRWNNGDTTNCITVNQAGSYSVIVSDTSSCSAQSNTVSILSSPPTVSISAAEDTICSGDSTQVCAPAGFSSYQWNVVGNTDCIEAKQAGNYYVTVTDSHGCTVQSAPVAIAVYPVPSISVIVEGDTLSSYGAVTYQWLLNDSIIPGATSAMYIAKQPGSYSLEITDTRGCNEVSQQFAITGIEQLAEYPVLLYPNPGSMGCVQLVVGNELIGSQLEVYDDEGRLVLQSEIRNQKSEITVAGLPSGVYFLRISSMNISITRKLVRL